MTKVLAVTVDTSRGITSRELGEQVPVTYEYEGGFTNEIWMTVEEGVAEVLKHQEAQSQEDRP